MSDLADTRPRRGGSVSTRRGVPLSDREIQVLTELSSGVSYGEIAANLFIAKDTVKTHLKRIFVKLGAKNGAHAVRLGYQLRILTHPEDAA